MSFHAPSSRRKRLDVSVGDRLLGAAGQSLLRTASLETFLTHPLLFGLTTASPLQRAICRVAEGRPLAELAEHSAVVRQGFGATPARPKELAVIAGVRGGKSFLAGAMICQATYQADLSDLKPGDLPRAIVISAKKDNAHAVYRHIAGAMKASPLLRTTLLTDPDNSKSSFMIRRPDGREVEIVVIAAGAEGVGATSFWLVAFILDEYARMSADDSDGVINHAAQRNAGINRIRPGGYLVHITSPLGEYGPTWDHVENNWRRPTPLVAVIRGRGDEMNPFWWTPARIAEAEAADPESYRTDFLGEFASPESAMFHGDFVEACTRANGDDLPRDPRNSYAAWMDPATRGNGWTFGVFTRDGDQRILAAAREVLGSTAKPLDPEDVIRDTIAPLCKAYGIENVGSDQWSGDALNSIAKRHGIRLTQYSYTDVQNGERYRDVRTMLSECTKAGARRASLPRIANLKTDLVRVRKRVTNRTTVHLPKTPDGRHCDWAPTLVGGMLCTIEDRNAVEMTEAAKEEARAIAASVRAYDREHGIDEDDE